MTTQREGPMSENKVEPWELVRDSLSRFNKIFLQIEEEGCIADCPPEWPRCSICLIRNESARAVRELETALKGRSLEEVQPPKEEIDISQYAFEPRDQICLVNGAECNIHAYYHHDGTLAWSWGVQKITPRGPTIVGNGAEFTKEEAIKAAIKAATGGKCERTPIY